MDMLLKLGNFFGLFNKARLFLQGKKTYLINTAAIVSALGVMAAAGADALSALGQILGAVLQFSDGNLAADAAKVSIMATAHAHAAVLATFGGAWATFLQACQNISKYAQQIRAAQATIAATSAPIAHMDVVPIAAQVPAVAPEDKPC